MKVVFCVVLLCTIEFSCILGLPKPDNGVDVTKTFVQNKDVKSNKDDISTYYIPTPGIGTHKYHAERKNWNDARVACLDEGGHLVIINSAAEEALVIKYINTTAVHEVDQLWTGVHDLFHKFQWTSVKDQRLDAIGYVHWSPGQPDNTADNERCLGISPSGLNDYGCSSELPFVCEI